MIRLKVETRIYRMMAERNIRSCAQLSRMLSQAGVRVSGIHVNRIASGKVSSISYEILAGLCSVLSCQPGDLLRAVPEEGKVLPFPDKAGPTA